MGRTALRVLAVGLAVLFLRQMMAHYDNSGGSRGDAWRQPLKKVPTALANGTRTALADSFEIAVRPAPDQADSMFIADVVVTNRSGSAVGEVAIACDALGGSGETTGHASATLHQAFPAHATVTVPRVALHFIHRAASAKCAVVEAAGAR